MPNVRGWSYSRSLLCLVRRRVGERADHPLDGDTHSVFDELRVRGEGGRIDRSAQRHWFALAGMLAFEDYGPRHFEHCRQCGCFAKRLGRREIAGLDVLDGTLKLFNRHEDDGTNFNIQLPQLGFDALHERLYEQFRRQPEPHNWLLNYRERVHLAHLVNRDVSDLAMWPFQGKREFDVPKQLLGSGAGIRPELLIRAVENVPSFVAGVLKSVYDLTLYRSFAAVQPPEERRLPDRAPH